MKQVISRVKKLKTKLPSPKGLNCGAAPRFQVFGRYSMNRTKQLGITIKFIFFCRCVLHFFLISEIRSLVELVLLVLVDDVVDSWCWRMCRTFVVMVDRNHRMKSNLLSVRAKKK